eukprot:5533334-Pyramimonas_sp.AAC.1
MTPALPTGSRCRTPECWHGEHATLLKTAAWVLASNAASDRTVLVDALYSSAADGVALTTQADDSW